MRRGARALGRTASVGAVFALACAGGALLHLDMPAIRRAVAARVEVLLASTFAGRIVIERVEHVGWTGVDGLDARVEDPEGRTVVRLKGAHGRISTLALLRSLVAGGDILVELPELSAAEGQVSLDADAKGMLRLANAFTLRPSPAPASPSPPGRKVRVPMPHVAIAHVQVTGSPGGGVPIDADVDDLRAAIGVAPEMLRIDVSQARVAARGLPAGATLRGELDVHMTQPSARGGDRALSASWRGALGNVEGSATASYDGGEVAASLDVPLARPEDVRALWPQWTATAPGSAHVEAQGTWPLVLVRARASVGRGALVLEGPVQLGGDEVRASVRVAATSFDARALSSSAPSSDLAARGQVVLVARGAGVVGGALLLDVESGTVAGERVPAAAVVAQLAHDPASKTPTTGRATVRILEPGAPSQLSLRLVPRGSSLALAFDGSAEVPRLDAVPRLGSSAVRGGASAAAHGSVDLGTLRLDAQVDVTAADVAAGALQLRDAKLTAHASGKLTAPDLDADAQADGLRLGRLQLSTLHARGGVAIDHGVALRDVELAADDGPRRVAARAALVSVSPGQIRVDDGAVYGLGAPLRGSLRVSPGTVMVQAQAPDLDLGRVARLAGLKQRAGGHVALDVDAVLQRHAAQGRVLLDLSHGELASWHDAKAHVEATLDGRSITGHATASVGDIGSADVRTESLQIAGTEPLTWSSWRHAWGAVDLTANVDLAKLAAQLPAGALPVGMAGALEVQARLQRDSAADTTPDVDVTARTAHLRLTGRGKPAWQLEGVDGSAHARVDGHTGHTTLDGHVTDAKGDLATLAADSDAVPYRRLFGSEALGDVLASTPFRATLALPERDIDDWPQTLGLEDLDGQVKASVDWSGALLQPNIDVAASVRHGRTPPALFATAVDVDLAGHYDGAHADATVHVATRKGQVLAADAGVDVKAADLLAAPGGQPLPWKASAHAQLTDFPLQRVTALDDRQVSGRASGQITLERLHDDARATLALTLDQLHVGDVACRSAKAQATLDGHALEASFRIDETDGYAEARTTVGARWGAALVPSIDSAQPADVSVTARQLRAELLLPFLSGVFTQLGGRIDADTKVSIDPRAGTMRPTGTIALQQGVFELGALGGEFHDASAKLVMSPDGVVRLENATARGITGRLQAAATARFDGVAFGGLRAALQVPKSDPLPLVFQGVHMGMLDGRFGISADPAPGGAGLDVNVEVPSLRVQLPLSSTHDVQALGDLEGVRIGVQRGSDFVPQTLDPKAVAAGAAAAARRAPVKVTVRLGRDVQVLRGTDLDVRLEGEPTLVLAQDVRASGQIRILQGTILVQGKPFRIEPGNATVTFVGDDPSNPQVKLRAEWDAPDGTRIYAVFSGPLKSGKVDLQSDPELPKSQVLALLLFGTTDAQGATGAAGTQQANNAAGAAGGAAGAAATQPINRALGGVNHMLDNFGLAGGIQTKIDTSQATPRPEVELQIARDISLQVAWVIGVPPPGSNPDSTLFTLNWHFLRSWWLSTTVGDAGTSVLDLVWQHRY